MPTAWARYMRSVPSTKKGVGVKEIPVLDIFDAVLDQTREDFGAIGSADSAAAEEGHGAAVLGLAAVARQRTKRQRLDPWWWRWW